MGHLRACLNTLRLADLETAPQSILLENNVGSMPLSSLLGLARLEVPSTISSQFGLPSVFYVLQPLRN